MLVLGREDDARDVRAVASALLGSGSFDSAGVAEKFHEAALLGSRQHFAGVGPRSDVDAGVALPWPDALDTVAEFAGACCPLDVAYGSRLLPCPLLDVYKDELVRLGDDREEP